MKSTSLRIKVLTYTQYTLGTVIRLGLFIFVEDVCKLLHTVSTKSIFIKFKCEGVLFSVCVKIDVYFTISF